MVDAPDTAAADPASVLPWAIASAVLCFLPAGIVAVVLALRARAALEAGDAALAARRAGSARRWAITALVVGLVVDALIAAVLLLLGALG